MLSEDEFEALEERDNLVIGRVAAFVKDSEIAVRDLLSQVAEINDHVAVCLGEFRNRTGKSWRELLVTVIFALYMKSLQKICMATLSLRYGVTRTNA